MNNTGPQTVSRLASALGRPNPYSENRLKSLRIQNARLLDSRAPVFDSSFRRSLLNMLQVVRENGAAGSVFVSFNGRSGQMVNSQIRVSHLRDVFVLSL